MANTLREEIVTSKTAERMLTRVSPIYENSYVGLWMFQAIGKGYDELWDVINTMMDQLHPETATWSIELWEQRYGIVPPSGATLEERRKKIAAARSVPAPFNHASIINYIRNLLGRESEVSDNVGPYTFGVFITSDGGITPADYAEIAGWLDRHKHAHMSYDLCFQAEHTVKIKVETGYWRYWHHMTGQARAGEYPQQSTIYAHSDGGIQIEAEGEGYKFQYLLAGTAPDISTKGRSEDSGLTVGQEGTAYKISYPLCGMIRAGN